MASEIKKTVTGILFRGSLFSLIWYFLTDGAVASWWIGLPIVIIATMISLLLLPPQSFVWYEFILFIPFFLIRSVRGGIDVAWRAFHPQLPIAPDIVEYRLQLPAGLPRIVLANTVNLLPGTLSATLDENVMLVHVLDSRQDFLSEIITVEQRVARIFNLVL